MKSYPKLPLTDTPTSLAALTGDPETQCFEVLLQAPSDNSDPLYFGTRGNVNHFLAPGSPANPALQNMKDLYVKGSVGDFIIISKFSR